MKKNKMMRIASGLLVLNLMSTCAISGTFAKYVTKTSASDEARVAKFGVVVTASGGLFDTTYRESANADSGEAEIRVQTSTASGADGKKLVAPGTSSEEVQLKNNYANDGLEFAITGTPEVKVKVSFSVDDGWKDIFMKAKNGNNATLSYNDFTVHNPDSEHEWGTFTLDEDYHPLQFTLNDKDGPMTGLTDVPLETIVDYLNGTDSDLEFEANENLAEEFGSYRLTWKWEYDVDDTADKCDTFLGDYMANPSGESPVFAAPTNVTEGDISTDVAIAITVTVTQMD